MSASESRPDQPEPDSRSEQAGAPPASGLRPQQGEMPFAVVMGKTITELPKTAYFDSATSFGMIRGGHIDATVLGAFEVDQHGNIANWIIPNGKMLGVGGAMDLVAGANKVVVAMMHTSKGVSKLLNQCKLPITGYGEVDVVVTALAMIFFENGRRILKAIAPEVDVEYVRSVTEFSFEVSPDLKVMLD